MKAGGGKLPVVKQQSTFVAFLVDVNFTFVEL